MLDLLIKNAEIIDGTGKKGYKGNVGIKDGKIVFGERQALEEIDADGLSIIPGFIDAHSHSDITAFDDFSSLSKLSQGVTTHVGGNCSASMAPVKNFDSFLKFIKGFCTCPSIPDDISVLSSPEKYAEYLKNSKLRLNIAYFTGMGTLRLYAMDYSDKKPSVSQISVMKEMLGRAIDCGSLGLSTGLVYVPNCYSSTDEVCKLLKTVKEHNGLYATHVRNESNHVTEAYDEALECAYKADVPLFLSHFKAAGRKNWGKPAVILKRVDEYERNGLRVTLDHYPYLAGMTALNISIPPEFRKDGTGKLTEYLSDKTALDKIKERMLSYCNDYENYIQACGGFDGVLVSSCPYDKAAEGMYVTEYAQKTDMEPMEAYFDILRKNKGLGLAVYFHMCESDLIDIASHKNVTVGSDALFGKPGENIHPRAFGTFPQAYDLYVRNKKIYSKEEFVYRATGFVAERFGFKSKGKIADEYDADLVLIDFNEFAPKADYKSSNQLCTGIKSVFVNGKEAYNKNGLTEEFGGKVVLRK